jgi:hypothetical protein
MQTAIVSRTNSPTPIVADRSSSEQNRVAIFGSANDFVLKEQMIPTLDLWHRGVAKVMADCENSAHNDTEEGWAEYTKVVETQSDILNAALHAKLHSAGDVAVLLAMVVRHAQIQGDEVGEFINTAELDAIAKQLRALTDLLPPKKKVGKLQRGRKLTRAGLLYRYQAFLMKELETVSYNLYGDSRCALEYRMEDDAVNLRLRKRPWPLFDESKLPDRAERVLKSLKIDTENGDVLNRRGCSERK